VTTSLSKNLAKSYLSLFPVELQDYQTDRKPLQRASMEYEDEKNLRGFQVFFDVFPEQFDFKGKRVLDFGCGYGGRTVRYAELGAASVTGIEILTEMVEEARAFAAAKGIAATFVEACGERLPFESDSFDVICSYDVFEHVEDLEQCLNECWRVLAPGGKLYGVFPPYHHPTGGSHLHGYISKSPLPNVFFSGEALMAAATELMDARKQAFRPPPPTAQRSIVGREWNDHPEVRRHPTPTQVLEHAGAVHTACHTHANPLVPLEDEVLRPSIQACDQGASGQ
jgi:SAM-dependent methyltransferase